jgi:amino-acid N-acetyltransferase
MADVTIQPATSDDAAAVERLLTANGLPLDGVRDHLATALVARRDGELLGCAALELYPDGALLRSVAVAPAARGSGLGRRLTEAALALADRRGAPAVFLLTTTAEGYFPRFGFAVVPRTEVPPGVQQSVEFRSACPASAIVMRREPRVTA